MRIPAIAALIAAAVLMCGCDDDATTIAPPVESACLDYSQFTRTEGVARLASGPARSGAVAGEFLYIAGDDGVDVFDVGDPDRPIIVGRAAGSNGASQLAIADTVLCVGRGALDILFYSVARAPEVDSLARVPAAGTVQGMTISGTRLYIADSALGLQIIDISDPTQPSVIGGENTIGEARDVVVSRSTAYVADAALGLRVVDVSDPANTRAEFYAVGGDPSGIALLGRHLYVASGAGGLQVLDTRDLSNAVGVPVAGGAVDVAAAGGMIFVAARAAGTAMFDVSSPLAPTLVRSLDTPFDAVDVEANGDRVLIADRSAGSVPGSVQILRVLGTGIAPEVAALATPGAPEGVAVAGTAVYVCDGDESVQVIDAGDPDRPLIVGTVPGFTPARQVAVRDTLAFVSSNTLVGILDIRDPLQPQVMSTIPLSSSVHRFACNDSVLFVSNGTIGIEMYNIRDPANPAHIGALQTGRLTFAHAVAGPLAYVSVGMGGVTVFDTQSPPFFEVGFLQPGAVTTGLAVRDGLLYLCAGLAGLLVADLTDPLFPTVIDEVVFPGGARQIAFSAVRPFPQTVSAYSGGQAAYVTSGAAVHVLDMFDPRRPKWRGSLLLEGLAHGVAADGSYVYATDDARDLVLSKALCTD